MIIEKLKQLVSYFTDRPIFKHYGFTHDRRIKLKHDPTVPSEIDLLFYEIDPQLGVFEIKKIIHDGINVRYQLLHILTNQELTISKKWFEFFFIPAKNTLI
jgi:hypothetical protein